MMSTFSKMAEEWMRENMPIAEPSARFQDQPPHDPEAWRAPFVLWLDSCCTLAPRWFGGVASLHIAFCEWESERGGVPCTRDTFNQMLTELGFLVGEVRGVTLVSGLALKIDLEALQ